MVRVPEPARAHVDEAVGANERRLALVVRLDEVGDEVSCRFVRPIRGQPQAQPEGRAALLREVNFVVHVARTLRCGV